ncbi:hypothetical protein [Halobacillus sp. Nhm2S1]|nr:hypothetical protein [Halobacillus sp. Nhm2S1]
MAEKILKWSLYSLGAVSLIVIVAIVWVLVSGFQAEGNSMTKAQE